MMMKAALFDFDGVVVDTEGQYTGFWGEMGRIYCPGIEGFAHRIKGQTLTQIFDAHIPSEEDRASISAALEDFEHTMQFPYIRGVHEFVVALRREGVKCAIVTSSNDQKMSFAYRAIPSLQSDFDIILTADCFTKSKPEPECYLVGAKAFGLEPHDCVVFEDSLNGIRAGKAAGMYVVGLSTTNPADVIAPLCDEVIPDFQDYDYQHLIQ